MNLQTLPAEILFEISDNLTKTSDLHAFSLVTKRLNTILKHDLYELDSKTTKKALKWAIIHDRLNTAKLAIAGGAEINGWQVGYEPAEIPIILAAASGSLEITRLLLDRAAFVNMRSFHGNFALMTCDFSNTELVQLLVDAGAKTFYDGGLPGDTCGILCRAINTASAEVLRLLVKSGASVKREGIDLVINACQSRNKEGLVFLMEDEAFEKPRKQMKIITRLVRLGLTESISWMIDQGVKPWSLHTDGAFELVRTALAMEDDTAFNLLREHGLDINSPETGTGQTLFLKAFLKDRDIPSAISLLSLGSEPDCADSMGRTALHFASYYGHLELFTLLMHNGASINLRDNNGWSPLHCASIRGRTTIAKRLVEAGIDINIPDIRGYTALHIASARNHLEIRSCLGANGAKKTIECHAGHTADQLGKLDAAGEIKWEDQLYYSSPEACFEYPTYVPGRKWHQELKVIENHRTQTRTPVRRDVILYQIRP